MHLIDPRGPDMVAYEFYLRDDIGDVHLIGVLPERRKDPNRITNQSILNWVEKLMGSGANDIFFTQVKIFDD
jgi:hypothetical protein